ncbi:MAG: helicase-related protein [Candidatus Izemoplasmatales bacterium]
MKESVGRRPPGVFVAVPGIAGGVCQRCGTEITDGVFDEWGKRYCRACLAFGHVDEDTVLYRYERPLAPVVHRYSPAFSPTPEQQAASAYVRKRIRDGGRAFVYAVCGAGKTEILYESILDALNDGRRVCIAIPRKDVVRELAGRLRPIFPMTGIAALYQGSKDDAGAHLIVATVHQMINYHAEFDLVVLDEADAFPYRGDAFLHGLVTKAMKPDAALVEMSATPLPGAAKNAYFLPARFHRRPLDVPVVEYVDGLRAALDGGVVPAAVGRWLRRDGPTRRALLFVPTVAVGRSFSAALERHGYRVACVSSREAASPILIRRFREGRVDLLVTTTLLERGVTFRAIDVAVLGADDGIFERNVLIQIAGRVGRSPDAPTGEVRFFAELAGAAMTTAIREIRKANRTARSRGLLDDGL